MTASPSVLLPRATIRWPTGESGAGSAVLVGMSGGSGRVTKYDDGDIKPLEGSSVQIAARIREYADLGLAEVQLVVDPITIESIQALAPLLADLDRG